MSGRFTFLMAGIFLTCCGDHEPVSITFTGDVILGRGVADEMAIHGDSILGQSMSPFLNADFNIVNLETVLTTRSNSRKQGYALRCDPFVSEELRKAQVTHASVANNHSFDFDDPGFQETIHSLRREQIHVLGTGCGPEVLSKGRKSVALLAAALTSDNGHLCIHDQGQLQDRVESFKLEKPEIPLVLYLHWGLEYQRKPEQWQCELARALIDRGADAIIGHHSHVFQGIEYYRDKPIIYSLGNFVADAYLPYTTEGLVATLVFTGQKVEVSVFPVDLGTYFPVFMDQRAQCRFLMDNLKYNPEMCYYLKKGKWQIKRIREVDFKEHATDWLFHLENEYQIAIRKLGNGMNQLLLYRNGLAEKSMALHGDLTEVEVADVTNDGNREILLGISKRVNFDRTEKKRLNIFRVEDGGIQAVWLGTRFLYDLQSYAVLDSGQISYLHTIEKDSVDQMYKAVYQWDEFGFALKTITKTYEMY